MAIVNKFLGHPPPLAQLGRNIGDELWGEGFSATTIREVNLLEIDALLEGERDLPPSLARLKEYQRAAWSVTYHDGRRRFQGWGWNLSDVLPTIEWQVDSSHSVRVDLGKTLADAVAFND